MAVLLWLPLLGVIIETNVAADRGGFELRLMVLELLTWILRKPAARQDSTIIYTCSPGHHLALSKD
jgi:hypothetical protein